jgi:enoyl-CoA hydratase
MHQSPSPLLRVDQVDETVWQLTLQRPEQRNALSIELRDAVSDVLDALADDAAVSVVVITGSGGAFSAGFDLKEFEAAAADPALDTALWASSHRWHTRLRTFPLPLIASVNGPALAGGFDLATMCDLRIAARSAWFARPEVEWSPALYSIVRDLVGGALARELTFTNRRLSADEALDLHLVTRVVDDADLPAATLALAQEVARAGRDNLRRTKATAVAASKVATEAELAW